jgi:alkanesulfonate monooxygenase SsuD/methylene tetrahydromethanopterin reductase-like flavin-dependent oxidoreductase (luciferase family)
MELGYFAMPLHEPGADLVADWLERDLWQIEVLDELGFAEAWIGEHNATPWEPLAAPDLFIAAALQRTSRIRLGTGVNCLPHHHPVQLANRVAILDHLARGRFNWGIGIAGFHESDTFGVNWQDNEHRRLFREVLDGVLDLWDDPAPGPRSFAERPYNVVEPAGELAGLHLRPFQLPHPPIAVACVTPTSDSARVAGEHGWILMSLNLFPAEVLRLNWETYAQGATDAGRTADRALWRIAREVHVAETPAKAREEALGGAIGHSWRRAMLPTFRHFGAPIEVITGGAAGLSFDDMDSLLEYCCEHIWVVGDAEEVAEKLIALDAGVGGFATLLVIAQDWKDPQVWRRSMTLLAEEVMPHVEAAAPSART